MSKGSIATQGPVQGCQLHKVHHTEDMRGSFRKVFAALHGHQLSISEIFWSHSRQRTIRGMHWQSADADGFKIVWTTHGVIRDVVLDLRPSSSSWLNWQVTELSQDSGALYVPPGCAHGFEVLSEHAVVNYVQEKPYSPELERGLRWDSIPEAWLTTYPTLSKRDADHPTLATYLSEVRAGEL